jgi:hypothetical protein
MADETTPDTPDLNLAEIPEDFGQIADQIVAGIAKHLTADTVRDLGVGAVSQIVVAVIKVLAALAVPFAELGAKTLVELEEPVVPVLASFVAPIVSGLFGSEASPESFHPRDGRGAREGAANAVIEAFNAALYNDQGGELEPGDEGAKRVAGAAVHATIEGWLNGKLPEILGEFIPIDWLHFKEFTELSHEIIHVLGLNRLVRSGFAPLVEVTARTPMQWYVNKVFSPTLLAEGEIVRAFQRGDYSGAEAAEELGRLGYSTRRQDLLIKSAAKRLALDDALQLARHGTVGRDYVLQNLVDQGYDQTTAEFAVVAAESKRYDAVNDNSLAALVSAYKNRDITDSELSSFLNAIIVDEAERGGFEVAARTQRELNVRHLSAAEVIDCCELGIVTTAYYRNWLEREGYPPDEAIALEIRLRMKIDKQAHVEEARAAAVAERAEAQRKRAEAAAQRAADVEAQRAQHRRGSLGDIARAVVRGLIPIARYQEVLTADYDADTVQIMVSLVEGDRQLYLEQLQRAADAKQRAGIRNIDVGALEQAVLNDVLTVQEFRGRLVSLGFPADDAAILTSTLEARKKDTDDARTKRLQAETLAKSRSIDLGRLERLVRRGGAPMSAYAAQLAALGYDEGSRAAMMALLQIDIADDSKARAIREAKSRETTDKGLTLEQERRAVLLGSLTEDQFQTYLVNSGYTSDAQIVLMAELRRDVADAEAARLRRETADAASGVVALSLSRVSSAARLGLIPPDAYQARLERDGYSPADVAIEMDLLLTEMADVQAARARRDELAAAADQPRAVSISQIERAVRAGTALIADYRAALSAVYAPADVALLVSTLEAERSGLQDASARRTTINGELAARTLSLGQLEAAVKAGAITLDAYVQQLVSWGYGSDDADLLASLLADQLSRPTTPGSNG